MPITAREAAFKTIGAYRRDKNTRPIDFLNALTAKQLHEARDCALATQLVRGILQNMALCDYYASKFSSVKLTKLEPQVLDILRISIYLKKTWKINYTDSACLRLLCLSCSGMILI